MLNIQHNKTGFNRTAGFTIVELMVAMLIGIIIMGGVMKLFISTRDTQRTSEDQLQLVADARFVMETIAFDLRHAGLWGGTNETNLIACKTTVGLSCSQALSAATDDCYAGWYSDLDFPVVAFDGNNPYVATCAKQGYQPGTDVLGLHYADSIPIATGILPGQLASGVIYIRSNIKAGQIFQGNTVPSSNLYKWDNNTATQNYQLKAPLYYVSNYTDTLTDGVPSLHRVELGAGPAMADDVLIPGVEDFQVEFGLDTTNDFQVNTYVDASNVTNANWINGSVIAVKIWLLMRAENVDRDGVGGSQTFKLANNAAVTYSDGVKRFLMTGVVRLRNTARLDLLTAGAVPGP